MNRIHLHTLFSGLELLGKYSFCNIVECRNDWIRVGGYRLCEKRRRLLDGFLSRLRGILFHIAVEIANDCSAFGWLDS